MLLGKRARHPMKRTTSMTEFSFEDLTIHPNNIQGTTPPPPSDQNQTPTLAHTSSTPNHKAMAMVSPRLNRRNSADYGLSRPQSPSFLATCSLCSRRLPPGRDIFMYRGDSAFCSLECRQQRMTQDEWKEKSSVSVSSVSAVTSSTHKESNSSHSSTAGSPVVSSTKGETVAAL